MRVRIIAIFLLLFILVFGATATLMSLIASMRSRSEIVDRVELYVSDLQEARRFEKNYFLYGDGISDALSHIHLARTTFDRTASDVAEFMGKRGTRSMRDGLDRYQALLNKLAAGGKPKSAVPELLQAQIRTYGAQALLDAQRLVDEERQAMRSELQTIGWAALLFLLFMFFVTAFAVGYIVRGVLKPLKRFMRYAERIGRGDYSPITPLRKYRDEFSELAFAMNRMMHELKSNEDQLFQTKKMAAIGSLTSGIAHELNNPLNNIALITETFLEEFDELPDDKKRHMLDQIYTQVERSSSTVRNLLDFTRKEQPVFTRLDVAEVVRTTANLVGNEANLAGVKLKLDLPEDLPAVNGNPRNLQQVFLNLFLNGIQAMQRGGRLDVRASTEDEFVRIDVSDTGVGIKEEHLDKVFDPFFTTKEEGEGTGLGLSVSYSIIEKHGGKMSVSSKPGKGATFSVFFPIKQDS
jgi:signal transduction histidine kinase